MARVNGGPGARDRRTAAQGAGARPARGTNEADPSPRDDEFVTASGKVLTESELYDLAAEAERGYCTEWLGGTTYCLRPAVAEVNGTGRLTDGLKCEQHVKGWPESVVTWLEAEQRPEPPEPPEPPETQP